MTILAEPPPATAPPRPDDLASPADTGGHVPAWWSRSPDQRLQALARTTRPDFADWVTHVRPAAGCIRPIRLAGASLTLEAGTGRVLTTVDTAGMPDGVIYKPCGNRRGSVCPTCSKRYQRDAYQVVRSGLVGGKGVPEHVATHPAVFPTLTAPSFGEVHTRYVKRHTCESRRRCDCRPEPCHPRRDNPVCPHGSPLVCYARHEDSDRRVGTALCADCYDYAAQVVWNMQAGELWRRTTIAANRYLHRLTRSRGIPDVPVPVISRGKVRLRRMPPFKLSFGKAAEMQRRGVVHFHAIVRLDGRDPNDPTKILPPPAGVDADDLKAAINHAAHTVTFTTDPHPARPDGWQIGWGTQVLTKVITVSGRGEITDAQVTAYVAKYATKSTEATGHTSARLTDETVNLYADGDGTHTQRLVEACWQLGQPRDWRRLRRWAHMLGFGGHFLTKSRSYSVTFTVLRHQRIVYRRTQTTGPQIAASAAEADTTLVVNFLQFVGAGWHTTADAMLANTSAALAREHEQTLALAHR